VAAGWAPAGVEWFVRIGGVAVAAAGGGGIIIGVVVAVVWVVVVEMVLRVVVGRGSWRRGRGREMHHADGIEVAFVGAAAA
jgi:hypothetical protein